MLFPNFMRFHAVVRREDPVAITLQNDLHEFTQEIFILNHQNRFIPSQGDRRGLLGLLHSFKSNTSWKEHLEGRTMAKLAGHLNPTSVLLHNAVDCGQPHARSFPDWFCGEERFE